MLVTWEDDLGEDIFLFNLLINTKKIFLNIASSEIVCKMQFLFRINTRTDLIFFPFFQDLFLG